jgi:hypothetical protein
MGDTYAPLVNRWISPIGQSAPHTHINGGKVTLTPLLQIFDRRPPPTRRLIQLSPRSTHRFPHDRISSPPSPPSLGPPAGHRRRQSPPASANPRTPTVILHRRRTKGACAIVGHASCVVQAIGAPPWPTPPVIWAAALPLPAKSTGPAGSHGCTWWAAAANRMGTGLDALASTKGW